MLTYSNYSSVADYVDLTSANNEAIVIACLHLSLHLLRSVTNKDDECLTDQVIECADRIEGYIVEQRRMSNEDTQFLAQK